MSSKIVDDVSKKTLLAQCSFSKSGEELWLAGCVAVLGDPGPSASSEFELLGRPLSYERGLASRGA